jgi:hypothetical protein
MDQSTSKVNVSPGAKGVRPGACALPGFTLVIMSKARLALKTRKILKFIVFT